MLPLKLQDCHSNRETVLCVVVAIVGATLWSCSPTHNDLQQIDVSRPQLHEGGLADSTPRVRELVQVISSVPPWRTSGIYSPDDWERLRAAAATLQSADPDDVTTALQTYPSAAADAMTNYHIASRPFLLLRVMFELPNAIPMQEFRAYGGGWLGRDQAFTNETVDLSWPIKWADGKPTLIAPFQGYMGPPYAAAEEYRAFQAEYLYRDLAQ